MYLTHINIKKAINNHPNINPPINKNFKIQNNTPKNKQSIKKIPIEIAEKPKIKQKTKQLKINIRNNILTKILSENHLVIFTINFKTFISIIHTNFYTKEIFHIKQKRPQIISNTYSF